MTLQLISRLASVLGFDSRPSVSPVPAAPVAAPAAVSAAAPRPISAPGPHYTTHNNKPCLWNMLPHDIRKSILLQYVPEPTHTALIDKRCRLILLEACALLLQEYAASPHLNSFVKALPPGLSAVFQVKKIYKALRASARAPIVAIPNPLSIDATYSTSRLEQLKITRDKAVFFRAAFAMINQDLSKMTDDAIIEFSRVRFFVDYAQVFEIWPGELDLDGQGLTYISPHIALLKGVTRIRFVGNPLTPETVQDACKALPKLIRVAIEADQTALAEMFQQHFPELGVTRVHNLPEM